MNDLAVEFFFSSVWALLPAYSKVLILLTEKHFIGQ